MGAWRVEQHYGVGAAHVRLCPEPYLHPERSWGLFEGLEKLREDIRSEGRSWAGSLAVLPIGVLGLVIAAATLITAVRERVDDSSIEVVMLRNEPLLAEVEPKPESIRKPTPKPTPVIEPRPQPKFEPPPPPPPPKLRSRVQIDRLAKKTPAAPVPAFARPTRAVERKRREAPPPVAAFAKLDAPVLSPSPESRRFATVRPEAGPRSSTPKLAPMIASLPAAPPDSPPAAPTRRAARSDRAQARARAVPAIENARLSGVELPTDSPSAPARRADRAALRDRPGGARRNKLDLASLSAPAAALAADQDAAHVSSGGSTGSGPSGRTGAISAPSASRRSQDGQKLRGVPLGSLASCVSDREEDTLKQRVIAAVAAQKTCTSRAGRYQFVETKNLNSFLMWVEPAAGRRSTNRCDELRLALGCLDENAR
jgi:hypothetical protein